jgi:hypothetical protein
VRGSLLDVKDWLLAIALALHGRLSRGTPPYFLALVRQINRIGVVSNRGPPSLSVLRTSADTLEDSMPL